MNHKDLGVPEIVGADGRWRRGGDILRFCQADSRLDCDRRLAADFSTTPAALQGGLGAAGHGQVETAGLVVVRCDSEIAEFLEIVDGLLGRGRPRAIPAGVVYFRAFAAVVEVKDTRLVAVGRPSFVGLADAPKRVYVAIIHGRRFWQGRSPKAPVADHPANAERLLLADGWLQVDGGVRIIRRQARAVAARWRVAPLTEMLCCIGPTLEGSRQ